MLPLAKNVILLIIELALPYCLKLKPAAVTCVIVIVALMYAEPEASIPAPMLLGSKKLIVPEGACVPFCEAIETIFLPHGATRGAVELSQAEGMS
jgi:hypothetical protein